MRTSACLPSGALGAIWVLLSLAACAEQSRRNAAASATADTAAVETPVVASAASSRDTAGPGETGSGQDSVRAEQASGMGPNPVLPEPFATESAVKLARVVAWPEGRGPRAPEGFQVSLYAEGLDQPRWLYVLPNGDVLVAESNTERLGGNIPKEIVAGLRAARALGTSADRITLLRDADGDGRPEVRKTFLEGLKQPFGMLLLGDTFYVANTDALLRFPYRNGQTRITARGEKILDLPAGGYNNHWTRNVVANRDGTKLYVSVGSATNVDEEGIDARDPRRLRSSRRTPTAAACACSRAECGTRTAWTGRPGPTTCGPWSTSGTISATSSSPTT